MNEDKLSAETTVTLVDTAKSLQQRTISNRRKFSLSRIQKKWFFGAVVVLLLVCSFGTYSILVNLEPDAATCTSSVLKVGMQSSCAKYSQQLINGISEHYAPIPNNEITLPASAISTNGKYTATTASRMKVFQSYTGKPATGETDKETWHQLCTYMRSTYRSYSVNLRTSAITTARNAYDKVGCASIIQQMAMVETVATSEETATPASEDTKGSIINDEASTDTDNAANSEILVESDHSTAEAVVYESASGDNVTIASWNIEGGNPKEFSSEKRLEGLAQIQSSVDVISLQESHLASFRQTLKNRFLCETCTMTGIDFGTIPTNAKPYKNNGSLPSSLPIMWKRTKFDLENYGAYTVIAGYYKDEHGDKVSPKWITWAQLKDAASGQSFYVVNTHTVSSAEALGAPQKNQKKRNTIYTQHMDMLQRVIKNNFQDLPILLTGDFNVNYRYDSTVKYKNYPYARMTTSGLVSNWSFAEQTDTLPSGGTRNVSDTRLIDYVWLKQDYGATFGATSIHTNSYGSDHFPVFATINIK